MCVYKKLLFINIKLHYLNLLHLNAIFLFVVNDNAIHPSFSLGCFFSMRHDTEKTFFFSYKHLLSTSVVHSSTLVLEEKKKKRRWKNVILMRTINAVT